MGTFYKLNSNNKQNLKKQCIRDQSVTNQKVCNLWVLYRSMLLKLPKVTGFNRKSVNNIRLSREEALVSLFFRAEFNGHGTGDQRYMFSCVVLELCRFSSGRTVCTFDFFILTFLRHSLPPGLHVNNAWMTLLHCDNEDRIWSLRCRRCRVVDVKAGC